MSVCCGLTFSQGIHIYLLWLWSDLFTGDWHLSVVVWPFHRRLMSVVLWSFQRGLMSFHYCLNFLQGIDLCLLWSLTFFYRGLMYVCYSLTFSQGIDLCLLWSDHFTGDWCLSVMVWPFTGDWCLFVAVWPFHRGLISVHYGLTFSQGIDLCLLWSDLFTGNWCLSVMVWPFHRGTDVSLLWSDLFTGDWCLSIMVWPFHRELMSLCYGLTFSQGTDVFLLWSDLFTGDWHLSVMVWLFHRDLMSVHYGLTFFGGSMSVPYGLTAFYRGFMSVCYSLTFLQGTAVCPWSDHFTGDWCLSVMVWPIQSTNVCLLWSDTAVRSPLEAWMCKYQKAFCFVLFCTDGERLQS